MHVDRQVPQPGQLQRRAGVIGMDVRQQIAAGRVPLPNSDSAAALITGPRCGHAVSISTQAGPDRTNNVLPR